METKLLWLIAAGFLGGYLGRYSRIPGGVLLGSMVVTSWANAKGVHLSDLPFAYVLSLQVLAGALVGEKVTGRILKDMKEMMLPVFFLLTVVMASVLIVMMILYRVFGWDYITAWLSSSPGRMQDMIVLAGSLKADGAKVATVHLLRHLSVVFLTPLILLISKKAGAKQAKALNK
ncbi:AbrB family transcriptional regulator [Candidatus Formimonas warabiya]|uniref:AbrB family transcriptional regulator n=1 Tax=Formimonas warabiya TaxID=1761012 RepID=A0A3G1KQM7_FORW1|nr:AbrB family transcriptional regulator [Candidatus Formimonas warabiya]ATW24425.1 hypothetical protein DCMF_06165 [Candidatus Formimonas warabiya]